MQLIYPDDKAQKLIWKKGLCWKCQEKPVKMFITYDEIMIPLCWECRDDFWQLKEDMKKKTILKFQLLC